MFFELVKQALFVVFEKGPFLRELVFPKHLLRMGKVILGFLDGGENVIFHTHTIKANGAKVNPTGQLFSKKLFTKK